MSLPPEKPKPPPAAATRGLVGAVREPPLRDGPDDAEDAAESLSADELMADIGRPAIGRILLLSLAIHAALLLLTSVRFISLCVEHHTLDPRSAIREIEQQKREQELEAKREAARKKILAERAKKKAGAKAELSPAGPEEKGPPDAEPGEKPKVVKDVEAKSKERPKQSSLTLDELD